MRSRGSSSVASRQLSHSCLRDAELCNDLSMGLAAGTASVMIQFLDIPKALRLTTSRDRGPLGHEAQHCYDYSSALRP